ncbi:hypothetical protein QOZ80_5BG0435340 [Eleusine coracana subsp. coracana]|nr:hypothetical protein QOZ80_5BG0435340 [Eleusine coracana subsp. coracana]
MILGLLVDGEAVCGHVNPQGWRDIVEGVLGIRPPESGPDEKDKKPSSVSTMWLKAHFNELPNNANEDTVERYARAWLWHLVGGYLFPDGSENALSWLMLLLLAGDWDEIWTYSWGSATLAYLYRQLCDAWCCVGSSANLGGYCYLLQGWEYADEGSLPIVAFLWKGIINIMGALKRHYLSYNNDFDMITHSQAQQLGRLGNKSGKALRHPRGSEVETNALWTFVEMTCRMARRLAFKFNCVRANDVDPPSVAAMAPAALGGASSSSTATIAATDPSLGHARGGTQRGGRTRGRGKAVQQPQVESSETERSNDFDDEDFVADVIGAS